MLTVSYAQGADLPDLGIDWTDQAGELIDFSTGYSFELRVGAPGESAALAKSSGITGAATAPNVTISFDDDELSDLEPGHYMADLIATRTADGKDRAMRFRLSVKAAVGAAT